MILKDLFTSKDGESFDIGRVLWAVGVVAFIGFAGWAVVVNKEHFNALEYGGGLGLVLAAGGGALALKAKTEPGGAG